MNKKYYSLDDYCDLMNKKIVTTDIQAYINYPKYNFVYNKLELCKSQNIPCAPMGIQPIKYPVVFKPVYNLYGMSRSFYKIYNKEDYHKYLKDGLFWMPYYSGNQINLDVIYDNDKIVFYSALTSIPNNEGTFISHSSNTKYKISKKIEYWIHKNMKGYRGPLNMEIIQDNIIEVHLRLNGDFHLYDPEFVGQYIDFLEKKTDTIEYKIPNISIFPLFINKDEIKSYNEKKDGFLNYLNRDKKVITFTEYDLESLSQSHQLRALMIELEDYEHGKLLIDILKNQL
tara:strand:- start:819 stop:1673 length:855 start_codon:yes stop_codon:yes gene_type:complete